MPNSANLSGTSLGPTLIRNALASHNDPRTKKLEAVQVSGKALNAKLENTVGNQVNKHQSRTLKFCHELALLKPLSGVP
jgi:hypothetical protein